MFCTSCGKEIPDHSQFCEHCGAKQEPVASTPVEPAGPVINEPPAFSAVPTATAVASAPAASKPMSRQTKVILIAVVAVAVLFFGLRAVLRATHDPDKTINKFVEAVSAQDAEAVRSVTTVYLDEMELTDEALKPFFDAYSKNSSSLSAFQAALVSDLQELNTGRVATGDGFLCLKKEDHLLYSSYQIEITPLTVSVTSEFEDTALTLDGETYQAGDEPISVVLMPGEHSGSAQYVAETTGVTLESEFQNIVIYPSGSSYNYSSSGNAASTSAWGVGGANYSAYDQELYIYFNYETAYIESSMSQIKLESLLVDGNALDVNDYADSLYYGFYIGPVKYDSEITIKTSAYGFEQEDAFSMQDTSYYYIGFEVPTEALEQAGALAAAIAPDSISAVRGYDQAAFDRLVAAHGDDLNDDVVSSLRSSIESWVERASTATYAYGRNVYSDVELSEAPSVSRVSYYDDYITAQATLRGTMTVQYYPDWTSEETENEPTSSSFSGRVNLRYQDGKWVVTGMSW